MQTFMCGLNHIKHIQKESEIGFAKSKMFVIKYSHYKQNILKYWKHSYFYEKALDFSKLFADIYYL